VTAGVCQAIGCDRPAHGPHRYCHPHYKRASIYGQADDWLPIPHDHSPGADPDHVRRLSLLPWPQLVNWCDMTLHDEGASRYRHMGDEEFWALFADAFGR
jgi:hypothetical protein